MKLFCFPHAGGFSSHYAFLKQANYADVTDVFLYEYEGRNRSQKETPSLSFRDFVNRTADYVEANLRPSETFSFFGHSMGAFVAYETALLLSARNKAPDIVFLSGQRPPCTVEEGYYSSDPKVALPFLSSLGGMEHLEKAGPAVQKFFLPMILGDLRLLETYEPTIPDKNHRLGDCVLLHGNKDVELKGRDMRLWEKHFRHIRAEYTFDGGHFYFNNYKSQITEIIDKETSRVKL